MDRPVLAPGLRVLQRSRDELQIGLGPELTLPATEPVRRTLDHLARGEVLPADPSTHAVLSALAPVLVDGGALDAGEAAPGDRAAVALAHRATFAERLEARRRTVVAVLDHLGVVDARPLLTAAGARPASSAARATAALVISAGEVDREELDPLVRDRVPHVLVRLIEGTAVVGPFVDPGRTACLRCLDAHRAVDDPRAPLLASRHARAARDRRDGVAEPVDTALATLAVSWAVRDLVTHAEGDRPSTWSATVRLPATLAPVTQTEWRRHPGCGCTWLPDGTAGF